MPLSFVAPDPLPGDLAPNPFGTLPRPGRLEMANAAFGLENTMVAVRDMYRQPNFKFDPEFELVPQLELDFGKEKALNVFNDYLGVRSLEEYNFRKLGLARRQEYRETLSRGNFWSALGWNLVASVDPTLLVPLTWGGRGIATIGQAATLAFASTAVQEAVLRAAQPERTAAESIESMFASAVIGGVFGLATIPFQGKISRAGTIAPVKVSEALLDQVRNDLRLQGRPEEEIEPMVKLFNRGLGGIAAMTGKTPEEVYAVLPLDFKDPGNYFSENSPMQLFQEAYNGSAWWDLTKNEFVSINKFRSEFIGKGEGTQWEGFGHYFSSRYRVSFDYMENDLYRKNLPSFKQQTPVYLPQNNLPKFDDLSTAQKAALTIFQRRWEWARGDFELAIKETKNTIQKDTVNWTPEDAKEGLAFLEAMTPNNYRRITNDFNLPYQLPEDKNIVKFADSLTKDLGFATHIFMLNRDKLQNFIKTLPQGASQKDHEDMLLRFITNEAENNIDYYAARAADDVAYYSRFFEAKGFDIMELPVFKNAAANTPFVMFFKDFMLEISFLNSGTTELMDFLTAILRDNKLNQFMDDLEAAIKKFDPNFVLSNSIKWNLINSAKNSSDLFAANTDPDVITKINAAITKHLLKVNKNPKVKNAPGAVYKVDVPEEDELFDWHKGFYGQPPALQSKILTAAENAADIFSKVFRGVSNEDAKYFLLDPFINNRKTTNSAKDDFGWQFYQRLTYLLTNADQYKTAQNLNYPLALSDTFTRWRKNYDAGQNSFFNPINSSTGQNGSGKLASELLKAHGIPGLKYSGGGQMAGYYNYVIWDDEAIKVETYYQNRRGRIDIYPDRARINLLAGADASTFVHELGHYFLTLMEQLAKADPAVEKKLSPVRKWIGEELVRQSGGDAYTIKRLPESEPAQRSKGPISFAQSALPPSLDPSFPAYHLDFPTVEQLKETSFKVISIDRISPAVLKEVVEDPSSFIIYKIHGPTEFNAANNSVSLNENSFFEFKRFAQAYPFFKGDFDTFYKLITSNLIWQTRSKSFIDDYSVYAKLFSFFKNLPQFHPPGIVFEASITLARNMFSASTYPDQLKAIHKFYKQIEAEADSREYAVILDTLTGDFDVISGKADSVGVPLYKKAAPNYITGQQWMMFHNHPNNSNMSAADLSVVLSNDIKLITINPRPDHAYTMTAAPYGRALYAQNPAEVDKIIAKLWDRIWSLYDAIKPPFEKFSETDWLKRQALQTYILRRLRLVESDLRIPLKDVQDLYMKLDDTDFLKAYPIIQEINAEFNKILPPDPATKAFFPSITFSIPASTPLAAIQARSMPVRNAFKAVKKEAYYQGDPVTPTIIPDEIDLMSRDAQEIFARGFEQYLRTGIAPKPYLVELFDMFKQWLTAIYKSEKDLNVQLSDDIKKFFDEMFGGPEAFGPTMHVELPIGRVRPQVVQAPADNLEDKILEFFQADTTNQDAGPAANVFGLQNVVSAINPVLANVQQTVFPSMRRMMHLLADTGLQMEGNRAKVDADGNLIQMGTETAPGGNVQRRADQWFGWMARSIKELDNAYVKYVSGKDEPGLWDTLAVNASSPIPFLRNGKMSYDHFKRQVWMAMDQGDKHPIKEVQAVAQYIRKNFYDPFLKAQIEAGMWDKEPDVVGATSYVNRIYNVPLIKSRTGDFERIVATHLTKRLNEIFREKFERAKGRLLDLEERKAILKMDDAQAAAERNAAKKSIAIHYEDPMADLDRLLTTLQRQIKYREKRLGGNDPERELKYQTELKKLRNTFAEAKLLESPELTQWRRERNRLRARFATLDKTRLALAETQRMLLGKLERYEEQTMTTLQKAATKLAGLNEQLAFVQTPEMKARRDKQLDALITQLESLTDLDEKIASLDESVAPGQLSSIREEHKKVSEKLTKALARFEKTNPETWKNLRQALADKQQVTTSMILHRRERLGEKLKTLDPAVFLPKEKARLDARGQEVRKKFTEQLEKRGGRLLDFEKGIFDFTDEAKQLARHFTNQIVGNPYRLPAFDMINRRNSQLVRALDIPAKNFISFDGKSFLEDDIELALHAYTRTMAPDTELFAKFGTNNIFGKNDKGEWTHPFLLQLEDEKAAALELAEKNPDAFGSRIGKKLRAQWNRRSPQEKKEAATRYIHWLYNESIKNLQTVEQRLRHIRGIPDDPDALMYRVGKSAMHLQTARLMGTAVVSSIADPARNIMKFGLRRTFRNGIWPMITDWKNFRASAKEAELANLASELVSHTRAKAMAETFDNYGRQTKLERGIEYLSNRIGLISGLSPWTQAQKAFATVVANGEAMENIGIYLGKLPGDKETATAYLNEVGLREMARGIWDEVADFGAQKVSGVWLPNTEDWKDQNLAHAYRAMLNQRVNTAIITPGPERPRIVDSNLGWRLVFQFRSFGLSSTTMTALAGLQKRDMDVFIGATVSLALGALSYYTWAVSVGGSAYSEMQNASMERWMDEAIDRSGLLGVLSEVQQLGDTIPAISQYTRFAQVGTAQLRGRDPFEALIGAPAGLAKVLRNVVTGIDDPTKSTAHNIRLLFPYQNVWWFRQILDQVETSAAAGLPERRN